jgi:hypothetical protein
MESLCRLFGLTENQAYLSSKTQIKNIVPNPLKSCFVSSKPQQYKIAVVLHPIRSEIRKLNLIWNLVSMHHPKNAQAWRTGTARGRFQSRYVWIADTPRGPYFILFFRFLAS